MMTLRQFGLYLSFLALLSLAVSTGCAPANEAEDMQGVDASEIEGAPETPDDYQAYGEAQAGPAGAEGYSEDYPGTN